MTTPSQEEVRHQRREQIEAREQENIQADRRRVMRQHLVIWGSVGAVVLLVALGIGWAVYEATRPLPGEPVPMEGRLHVEVGTPILYNTYPPASGPHFPAPARWQFFDAPLQPGYWVHNLEHGGIVILYNCPEDCSALQGQLRGLYDTVPDSRYGYPKLVVAPDNEIEGLLTILAWDRRATFQEYDEATLQRFYQALVDKGPEDAP